MWWNHRAHRIILEKKCHRTPATIYTKTAKKMRALCWNRSKKMRCTCNICKENVSFRPNEKFCYPCAFVCMSFFFVVMFSANWFGPFSQFRLTSHHICTFIVCIYPLCTDVYNWNGHHDCVYTRLVCIAYVLKRNCVVLQTFWFLFVVCRAAVMQPKCVDIRLHHTHTRTQRITQIADRHVFFVEKKLWIVSSLFGKTHFSHANYHQKPIN